MIFLNIMDYNDLSKLCESLSLSEDDDISETKIKGEVKREVGLILGKMTGRVKEIDLGYSGDCFDKFLRIRHPLRECPSRRPTADEGRPLKYGAWIRAGAALGEEPRGKPPRGEGDQHSAGTRQGLLEPKLTSWWKPKTVMSSTVAEM
ncbi:hypothetical protein Q3G72_017508 [Acer saccharum]|nr:hypothetical protein Q3G72_017508 [Acer saccharum]